MVLYKHLILLVVFAGKRRSLHIWSGILLQDAFSLRMNRNVGDEYHLEHLHCHVPSYFLLFARLVESSRPWKSISQFAQGVDVSKSRVGKSTVGFYSVST